ncbi:MAG: DoxX family protein [Ferruginibacter sp.]
MKPTVTIIRILTGLLFIFSGLVKAIDPLGLAYKMQEFFEVWGQSPSLTSLMNTLDHYVVAFSIIMITLEVVVGVALLAGWQKKLTAWILVLLMLFFTFLTSFVLFTGKIRACGCFGDCIPLTPMQTFTKDIVLLLFAFFILFNTEYISPIAKPLMNSLLVFVAAALTLYLQFHVMKHLPAKDCLPFKAGNNILELRKMPADAVPDKYDYVFIYEKDGVKKEFPVSALPDSTWKFSDRKQMLVEKGKNNIPLINDFSLTTTSGADSTETILNTPGEYYLCFIKQLPGNTNEWLADFKTISEKAAASNRNLYIVTGQTIEVSAFLEKNKIVYQKLLTCDVTSIKTAARATPTIFLMKGPVVQGKWSWADFDEVK